MLSFLTSFFKTEPKHITQLDPKLCKIIAQTNKFACVECKDGSKWAVWFGGQNSHSRDGDLFRWDMNFESLFNDPDSVTWRQGQAGSPPPFNL